MVSDDTVRNAEPVDDVSKRMLVMDLASIHLVNLSTTTSRWVKPLGPFLRGPTMLRPQTVNGQVMGMV